MVEVVRTTLHPFSQILKNFPAHWRTNRIAPSSDNFQFFPEKNAANTIYIGLQTPTLCLVGVTQLRTDSPQRYFKKK